MDRNTPWRALGPTNRDGWKAWLLKRGSPMLAEADSTYDAAAPHHRLIAGMLWAESMAAQDMTINPYSSMNPLNHRNVETAAWWYGGRPGPAYMVYPDWATCIRATIKRLSYPGYKNGIYSDKLTLLEMISTYAPASDGNDPDDYVETILFIANELPSGGTTPPPTGTKRTWRDVAKKSDIRISQPWNDPSPDTYGPSFCMQRGRHVGLDIGSLPRGTTLLSLTEGVVAEAIDPALYYRPSYVIVERDNGHRLLYGHLWSIAVKEGQRLNPGDVIGTSGEQTIKGTRTPDGTGPHLHLEVWEPGPCPSGYRAVDPATYDFGGTEEEPDVPPITMPTIEQQLIPIGQKKQRSGTSMLQPRFVTIHETGNRNRGANAQANADWVKRGADGATLSVHFFVDDTRIIQQIPSNEVAWHAGDGNGPGNMSSLSIETCVNSDGDLVSARANVRKLAAVLMRQFTIPLANVVQHNQWSGKNCPELCRSEPGCWEFQVAEIWKIVDGTFDPDPEEGARDIRFTLVGDKVRIKAWDARYAKVATEQDPDKAWAMARELQRTKT